MTAAEGAARIVRDCVRVKAEETVAIITDSLRPPDIARQLFLASIAQKATCVQLMFDGNLPSEALPDLVSNSIETSDVVFCITTQTLGYAPATAACIRRGGRVITMTEAPEDFLTNPALNADFDALKGTILAVQTAFDQGHQVHVTAPGGTDLTFRIAGRQSRCCTGTCSSPGIMAAVPDMEVYIAPLEGTAEGTLVADLSATGLGLLEQPVTLSIHNGRAEKISGNKQAEALWQRVRRVSGGDVLAEFAVGLNPNAKPCGSIVIDEGIYGTGHFALGSNTGFGGRNACTQHLDLVYWKPTIWLDQTLFMKDGALC